MDDSPPTETALRRFRGTLALSLIGGAATGILGALFGVFAFLSSEWTSAAGFLVAAAIAFGLLGNALLRR
jgi:hypothetical protein